MAIVAQERVGNIGYLGLAPETAIGTAALPDDWTLLYDETMTTNYDLQDQSPIYGVPFETYQVLPGQRAHTGEVTVVAEPNTLTYFLDMLYTRGTATIPYTFTVTSANATVGATYSNNGQTFTVVATIVAQTTLLLTGTGAPAVSGTLTKVTGTGDATITFSAATNTPANTWPFTLTANPTKSYTMDVSTGNFVKRFMGVMASKVTPSWNKNELQLKVSLSALSSFIGAQLASTPTGSGPYTVVLDTTYSPTPTNGLVVGDLIRFYHQGGSAYTDVTVASVTNSTTFTTTTNVTAFVTGDQVYLRPATPSFNTLNTFLWSNTQFQFGATLTAAASAVQTRVEQGSTWELMNNFEKDTGSDRSGNADPASLVRTTGNVALTIKKFFDLVDDVVLYKQLTQTACIVTHFAGSSNQYQFQISYPQLTTDNPLPSLKAKEVNYSTIKMHPAYNQSAGNGFSIQVKNGLTVIS